MAYDEGQVREFAQALFAAGDSMKDGVQAGDAIHAVPVIQKLTTVLDEMKDTDAFACHLASELTDLLGDRLVDKAVE